MLGFPVHGRRAQRCFSVQQCRGQEVDGGIAAVGIQFFVCLRKDAVGFGDALMRWAFRELLVGRMGINRFRLWGILMSTMAAV